MYLWPAALMLLAWVRCPGAAVTPARHQAPPPLLHAAAPARRLLASSLQAPLVQVADSVVAPYSRVGQLASGCTAFLIGPCHALTVAHCVYDPHRDIWWPGVELFPGRNVQANGSGWSPLGSFPKRDVRLSPGWRREPKGAPEHDIALIQLGSRVGDRLGHFRLPTRCNAGDGEAGGASTGRSDGPAASVRSLGAALGEGPILSVVGYPDNKRNGTMWEQAGCSPVRWGFEGGLLWHACSTRGGNSGSPLFVSAAALPSAGAGTCGNGSKDGASCFVAVAMHIASLRVPRGSTLGRGLEAELRAGEIPVDIAAAGSEDGEEALVVPLALPIAGETLEWLKRSLAEMSCAAE